MTHWSRRLLFAFLVASLAPGCTARKPSIERNPASISPAESDSRRLVRIQETLASTLEQTRKDLADIEALPSHGTDKDAGTAAAELRRVRDELEHLRGRANDTTKPASYDDLERDVRRLGDRAEQLHADALRAARKETAKEAPAPAKEPAGP